MKTQVLLPPSSLPPAKVIDFCGWLRTCPRVRFRPGVLNFVIFSFWKFWEKNPPKLGLRPSISLQRDLLLNLFLKHFEQLFSTFLKKVQKSEPPIRDSTLMDQWRKVTCEDMRSEENTWSFSKVTKCYCISLMFGFVSKCLQNIHIYWSIQNPWIYVDRESYLFASIRLSSVLRAPAAHGLSSKSLETSFWSSSEQGHFYSWMRFLFIVE